MTWSKSHNLADLAYVDVQEYLEAQDLVLVPIGSCEKHGAHIPLGTDSFITIGVAEQAAREAGVLHTPLGPIGYSPRPIPAAWRCSGPRWSSTASTSSCPRRPTARTRRSATRSGAASGTRRAP